MAIEKYGRCPCDSSWVSQGYKTKTHKAIDLGFLNAYGANLPVMAWKSGVVVATGTDSAGGVYVVLQHDDVDCVWITRYWHFKKGSVVVKKGQTVKQGDKLGLRGNTGISSGVHLHFELWLCPKGYKYKSGDYSKYAVNPLKYTYLFEGQVMKGDTILPSKPVEVEIVKPVVVAEDTTKWQVEVIADALNVRTTPSLSGKKHCICPKGIFNVIQSQDADGYTWYEIETDRWIATKEGSWTINKPIPLTEQEKQILELQKQVATQQQRLTSYEKQVAELNTQLSELRTTIKSLQAENDNLEVENLQLTGKLNNIKIAGGW